MKLNRTKRSAAAVAIGASVLTGGALGAAFVSPLGAGAATPTTESTASDATASADQARPATPPWVSAVLDQLVTDGTLDQAQRDAVQSALEAAQPEHGSGDHGPGDHGPGGRHGRGPGLETAATALGVTADELRAELDGGSTIAEVAATEGVDVQVVIDALVADMATHLDQAVSDGRITQEQADARAADSVQRATDLVNGVRPAGGPDGGQPPADAPAPADASTTTEG